MAVTPITSIPIDTFSNPINRDTQTPAEVSDAGDKTIEEWPVITGQIDDVSEEMNVLGDQVNTLAEEADTSATSAANSANAAEQTADITKWLIGTTYAEGVNVYGTDFLTRRSAQAGNIGHDPVGDDGTWWVLLTGDVSFTALYIDLLSDATTPSVLTVQETKGTDISNYQTSGADHVFTMPAAHAYGNVIFTIGDEFQVDIEPDSGEFFYLNGTAMATDEHIVNSADTIGQQIVGRCAWINGTLIWMFNSSDSDFVEATP